MTNDQLLSLLAALVGALLVLFIAIFYLRQARVRYRTVLPMSTGRNILPGQSAQITGRCQRNAFRPERLFIGGGSARGAADWIVNDLKIAGQPQFAQEGDVPGDMFAASAIGSLNALDTVNPLEDVTLVITYVGTVPEGEPFYAAIVGSRCKAKRPAKREQVAPRTAYAA